MSAQLPYLPPLKPKNAVQRVAEGVVEDVRATPSLPAKAGLLLRGSAAMIPASSRMFADTAEDVARAIWGGVKDFGAGVIGTSVPGAPAPALAAVPAVAAPVAAAPGVAVPATPATPVTPATQAQVKISTRDGLTVGRQGNRVAIVGDPNRPALPAMANLPVYIRPSPVATGISQQAAYAEEQRQAILAAAEMAAATGNAGNATARYNAVLQSLPSLSGQNNFASTQAQLAADRERTAVLDASNVRTVEAQRYDTDTKAKEVRRNAQPTVISEIINPDPTTRPFAPTIKQYGFVERTDDGKIIVKDMQGNVLKPAAAPVTRSEFITANKKANPGMSEADIGREYDKKYGGKT